MADDFNYNDSLTRYKERRDRVNGLYFHINDTYNQLTNVPESADQEEKQRNYIYERLSALRGRINNLETFLKEQPYR